MNSRAFTSLMVAGLMLAGPAMAATATARKLQSDLATVDERRTLVDAAQRLARLGNPPPLPDSLPQPFNPPGFNRSGHDEPRPAAGPAMPAKQRGDRDVLEAIADRVIPMGTFTMGGERFLQFSKKRLKVGDKLTVTHDGDDYTLELTAIDATNFTLRLNREEITRPIKPGK